MTALNATLKRQFHAVRYQVLFQIVDDIELHVTEEFLWLVPKTATVWWPSPKGWSPPKSWRAIIARMPERPISIRSETRVSALSLRLHPRELALKNLPLDETLFPASVWFIRMLQGGTILYEPDVSTLQQDSRLVSMKAILPDASNLPWMILDLQQKDAKMFGLWVSHIRTALPHLKDKEISWRYFSWLISFCLWVNV